MVRAAWSAIRASRYKSAPVMLAARLLAPHPDTVAARPDRVVANRDTVAANPDTVAARRDTVAANPAMLAARLLMTRSPTACSASGHTIRKPEPTWVMMANAIPVREPLRGKP